MATKKKKWIQSAKNTGGIKEGGLHKTLGIPAGEKIPLKKIRAAARSKNKKEKMQGILAITFRKMRRKKTGKK
ncbi:MAG: hypothetical protein ACTSR1_00310 [Candidatus Heimdallarchaeota archaeon]